MGPVALRREDITSDPRMASMVQRYHTWPTLQRQTNADHSFNLLRIYISMFGPPEPEVAEYIVEHDLPEIGTGDIPFPVKAQNQLLSEVVSDLERRVSAQLGLRDVKETLSPQQRIRVKVCDLLEMHEFGLIEFQMGNCLALPIIRDTLEAALDLARKTNAVAVTEAILGYTTRHCSKWHRREAHA